MFPLLAVLSLCGQPPEPIRVTTRLVEVNVVVRDKNGPVTGLHAGDFVLRDRGRRQKIAVFEVESSRVANRGAPLGPGEFANRPSGEDPGPRHAVAILWDHLNTGFGDASVARETVLKTLKQIQTRDRVCLYALDSELRVIQDFTSDSSLLVEALRNYREARLARPADLPILEVSSSMDARIAALYETINAKVTADSAGYRTRHTAAAVRAIANHFAGVPGRKSVIWIAGEVPGAAAGLASSGVAVYPVDLSGTSASTPQISAAERTVAEQSGGIAFVHDDVRAAIDRALQDSEVSYTLGFYPDRPPEPLNALKIDVTRKGLDAGYPHTYSGVVKPLGNEIGDALASPLDATRISLHVRLRRSGGAWAIALDIDPAEIAFEDKEGRQTSALDVALRQLSRNGSVLATKWSRAQLDFNPPQYLAFLSSKHEMNFTLPDPMPGLAAIRIAIEDRVSGRVGSITIAVPGGAN